MSEPSDARELRDEIEGAEAELRRLDTTAA
jgi:hypothetical protein